MKYCVGIIAYNPTTSDIENIWNYATMVEHVFVYDNTELGRTESANAIVNNLDNITILGDGKNNGLSIACSCLCSVALSLNYDYIILFDQDSRIDHSSIALMAETAYNHKEAAIVCPQIVYQGKQADEKEEIKVLTWCITSGSMINLQYYGRNWQFDENYFIDRVDADCCKQIQDAGLKILMNNKALLYQELGTGIKRCGKIVTTHSPLRHYYMFRNRLYFNNKYNISPIITLLQTLNHLRGIILWEPQKTKKISEAFRGIRDYYSHNMGKSR